MSEDPKTQETPEVEVPKRRISSRARTLAVLAAAIVVLVGGNLVAQRVVALWDTDDEAEGALLTDVSSSDVVAIEWDDGTDAVRVELREDEGDGEATSEEAASGDSAGERWVIAGDEGETLDADLVADLVELATTAEVSRSLSADSVTDDMGLSDPVGTILIESADGAAVEITVGANTADGSGCYVEVAGVDGAFVADSSIADVIASTAADLYAVEEGPGALSTNYVSFTVDRGDKALSLAYHEGGLESCYTDEYEWFADDGSGQRAIESSSATTLISVVNSVAWESCVTTADDGATDYGFGDPMLRATLDYTTETEVETGEVDEDGEAVYETRVESHTYELVVGAQAPSGGYYAQPVGSSAVYVLSADDVADLRDTTVDDLLPDDVCLMNWDTVDAIDVAWEGGSMTIEFVRETADEGDDGSSSEDADTDSADSSDGTDDSSDDVELAYRVNGEDADADAVEDLLAAVRGLASESRLDADAGTAGTFGVSLTFHRNTESNAEMTLGLSQYDTNYYLSSFNGENRQLVSRLDVNDLIDLIDALA